MKAIDNRITPKITKKAADLDYDEVGMIITDTAYNGILVVVPFSRKQIVCIGSVYDDDTNPGETWDIEADFDVEVVNCHLVID